MKKFLLAFALICSSVYGEEVYAIFNVEALKDSQLKLDGSGIVDQIKVSVGSKVRKGDILLNLANSDKIASLNMQKAQHEGYKHQYLFAKNQYERFERSGSAIDKNTLEQNFSNYKQLESTYLSSSFNIEYTQSLLDKTILKAPFDGVIASKNVELGDGVTQNSTILFRLVSNDKKIILQFDSKYISKVQVGDIFKYRVDGTGELREAKIYKIYPTVDVNTRKISAEAIIPDNLQAGLFGDGYISTK